MLRAKNSKLAKTLGSRQEAEKDTTNLRRKVELLEAKLADAEVDVKIARSGKQKAEAEANALRQELEPTSRKARFAAWVRSPCSAFLLSPHLCHSDHPTPG